MFYRIRNKKQNEIAIGTRKLKYNETMTVDKLEPLQNLIDLDYIEVIYPNNINITNTILDDKEFIEDNKKKDKLIECFFNYYLDKKISNEDLDLLKWFYKNIGFTSKISNETLNLLDSARNHEELTAVLLNHIYPELLAQHTNKK